MLAHGATPEICRAGAGVALVSTGSGPLHKPLGSVLEQSSTLTSLGGSVVPCPQSGSLANEGWLGSIPVSSMAIIMPSPLVGELPGGTAVPSQIWLAPMNSGLRKVVT